MKIRKSRLKEIISEEVANAKFIDISEDIYTDDEAQYDDNAAVALASEGNTLDELVVQEIIKALAENGGDLKGDEDEEEKRGGAIDPRTDTTKRDYVPQFEGKKDDDWMGDVKSTGEWTDYTVAELEKKKAALMKKEKRTAAEVKTVRQLNFAIRAKKGELSEEERT